MSRIRLARSLLGSLYLTREADRGRSHHRHRLSAGLGPQPLARNVRFFTMPAAAEAGFGAWLRCRPNRVPQRPPSSAPDLVCRAVSLILDGVLDDGGEDSLGHRLGVSARNLRRLLPSTWGVSRPTGWRGPRCHFARPLTAWSRRSVYAH
jgi:AraC family transcriptional regulator of adaptative response / DNA-3-methyladenine glycosylase II